ncbi:MAG: polyphosphate kinase 1 [Ignavibacteria bacterium CG_4_8_14_3_um_filter_37_9]|nr:polyphosphate kinase 1 [Ignavibacteria bacterium]OIO22630.1 MAG: RNA degradosome polyphosphate kinase [Ignavibacteria bacterium CG1_02_37_35]PIS44011.1 MAG: polyphosphate kinase 1 [Ignavibacteria bacterium CG08_land_8_20_14_0_20_37_9]PIW99133.1 MAG: polyphosphate kinase 1 [Ignavibacteria bacterium CG_4_8_14_3_um_filter_37_9]PIX94338.1 MAG: polyphosphate kinase 1 [Ignavibacteria bacterium CG_4_10_14_3_um_filter_37_18]PJC60191.1 MAG: polyphosphate kinase 1 [Ignavibacteria bacterium CG_4_9_14_
MIWKELLKKYNRPENFFNRDLSWIEFNRRVYEEALNPNIPLLDRIKFISIFFSNLDEFYMIRVSGLKEQVAANVSEPTIDGLTPREQLQKIESSLKPMLESLVELWKNEILLGLKKENVFIYDLGELTEEENNLLNEYFKKEIYPVLTPLAFDPGRPFPYISNLSLSLAVVLKNPKGDKHFARVKVPNVLPRLLRVDTIINPLKKKDQREEYSAKYIWVGDVIKANLHHLFPKMEILEAHRFRITRDTDIEIQEDEADDLLRVIEENIRQRKFGKVVRIEVEKEMPGFMIETLLENLEIQEDDLHVYDGPLGLSDLMMLYDLPLHQLKEKPFYPVTPKWFDEEEDIFSMIRQKDILLHHPYDSFKPVIEFIKQAANDPDVLAIKQTLYRVGSNSPIVKYLIEAAERGKQVAVLVELKARFDEENNIYWARELEKVGAHVVYGLVGLKTHAKMTLVVRKEFDGLKRYIHLATGNYNATTAKIYTDLGLFTTDAELCSDVSDVFNFLTGYSKQTDFNKLIVAPFNLRNTFLKLVLREIENVKNGSEGKIILKCNAIVDPKCIAGLYEASNSGVKIELIVRGICCLVPGVPGLSENISVRSVVGRYLEHSRIYYFYNSGNEEVYLSSADLMQRNLDGRVETTFGVQNEKLKKVLINNILQPYLKDNTKARILNSSMEYSLLQPEENEKKFNIQDWMMKHAEKGASRIKKAK